MRIWLTVDTEICELRRHSREGWPGTAPAANGETVPRAGARPNR
jgi:hypothetical protein